MLQLAGAAAAIAAAITAVYQPCCVTTLLPLLNMCAWFATCSTELIQLCYHCYPSLIHTCTQVLPGLQWHRAFERVIPPSNHVLLPLHPSLLLVNAMRFGGPGRARLAEALLARGVPLETVCPETGGTALHLAVTYMDAQVGRLSCGCRRIVTVLAASSPNSRTNGQHACLRIQQLNRLVAQGVRSGCGAGR